MAKSRVAPLKAITTPRLELVAATLPGNVAALLKVDIQMTAIKCYFWAAKRTKKISSVCRKQG